MVVAAEKDQVFNVWLAKLTGLYQMLDPDTARLGGANVYHAVAASLCAYFCVLSAALLASVRYNWACNMPVSVLHCILVEYCMNAVYKIWTVARHSDDIWSCLAVARYGFTSYDRLPAKRLELDGWRKYSVRCTAALSGMYCVTLVVIVGSVLAFGDAETPLADRDGAISAYRKNVLNLAFFVSADTYNARYNTFYFLEALAVISVSFFNCMFEILVITLCFAICSQLHVVCAAFESIGHDRGRGDSPVGEYTKEKKKISNDVDLMHDELKTIIIDHCAVLKKYEEFITIFQKVILFQIVILSNILISFSFLGVMCLYSQESSSVALTLEIMLTIPAVSFQLFMITYLFQKLHDQKDSIIFALYSSNWTEMNMKCRQLILLTMKMNNANQKKLKFTRTRIVDLEMFFKTMGNCYTVLSVLVNYLKAKNG